MSSRLLVFETESLQCCGVSRCPVATATMRSGPACSSATDLWLTTSPSIQVSVCFLSQRSMSAECKSTPDLRRKTLFCRPRSSDVPNATVCADGEDPAFFSTLVCCSLVNFAWTGGGCGHWELQTLKVNDNEKGWKLSRRCKCPVKTNVFLLFTLHIYCVLCFTKSQRPATALAQVFIFALQLPVWHNSPRVQLKCPAFSIIFNAKYCKLKHSQIFSHNWNSSENITAG